MPRGRGSLPPTLRLSRLAGPVLASPFFCFGSPAGWSSSQPLDSAATTKQHRRDGAGRRLAGSVARGRAGAVRWLALPPGTFPPRGAYDRLALGLILKAFWHPIHFGMQRRQPLNLRRLAERLA